MISSAFFWLYTFFDLSPFFMLFTNCLLKAISRVSCKLSSSSGEIIIIHSDLNLSTGLLKLNPNQALLKHHRPVKEELVQIFGISMMRLFDGEMFMKEIELKEGDRLEISANQYRIHSNKKNNVSIALWKFERDITKVIENIRRNYIKIV